MNLKEGDKAPEFSLSDTNGNIINLKDLKGKKLVLYFYPKDDTPGCTIEACEIRDNYSNFTESNIVVFGVSADNKESHRSFTKKFQLPFPLLSDTNKSMCKDYDVLYNAVVDEQEVERISRVTFVIDENSVISKIWNPVDPSGHANQILEFLNI
jgi:peroxiredoxin Q/BCP